MRASSGARILKGGQFCRSFTTGQAAKCSSDSYPTVLRVLEAGELRGGHRAKVCRWRIR
jgi:hypothetical protein